MKYKEYIEKHRGVLDPLEEVIILLSALSLFGSIADDIPNEELRQDINNLVTKHKEKILNMEVKDPKSEEVENE